MSERMDILSVRIPKKLLQAFEEKVAKEYLRVPDVIRSLIAEYVKEPNGEAKTNPR